MTATTRVYEIQIPEQRVTYAGTMEEVKAIVNERAADLSPVFWPEITVMECDCQSDKAGLLHALNRLPVLKALRRWNGTSRRSLKEVEL